MRTHVAPCTSHAPHNSQQTGGRASKVLYMKAAADQLRVAGIPGME